MQGSYQILLCPDSFKGSLTSLQAAEAIQRGFQAVLPGQTALKWRHATIKKVPMADGGEGTADAMVAATGGTVRTVNVIGPMGHSIRAMYVILNDGKTAVIDSAAASGLTLVSPDQRNPLRATSYGTGELIMDAVQQGCTDLIIGLGGTAFNDGGMGMAQALGYLFYDTEGALLGRGADQLIQIHSIDTSKVSTSLAQVQVTACCDVTNPLCGKEGASAVYGPQKGATPEMVEQMDLGLSHFADCIEQFMEVQMKDLPGAGAAGGMGGGLAAFLGAKLKPGFQVISETVGLELLIQKSQLVITGEGRTDAQTAYGKVPAGVAALASKHGVPVFCLSGSLGDGCEKLYPLGITGLFSIMDTPMSLDNAMQTAEILLTKTAENVLRTYIAAHQRGQMGRIGEGEHPWSQQQWAQQQ